MHTKILRRWTIKLTILIVIILTTNGVVGCSSSPSSTLVPTPTVETFAYQVRIEDINTGESIQSTEVTLQVGEIPLLRSTTDSKGYALFDVPRIYLGKSGRVTVDAKDYKLFELNVSLRQQSPPEFIKLEPELVQSSPAASSRMDETSSTTIAENPISPTEAVTGIPSTGITAIPSAQPSVSIDVTEWLICWHGRNEYEFLVAYPLDSARQGIKLPNQVTQRPWDSQPDDLANDSLKICLIDNMWYGQADIPWFGMVSYLRVEMDQIIVCESTPDCSGQQWSLQPSGTPSQKIVSLLRQPMGNGIQVIGFISSSELR